MRLSCLSVIELRKNYRAGLPETLHKADWYTQEKNNLILVNKFSQFQNAHSLYEAITK